MLTLVRRPGRESFLPVVEQYGALVYASAFRRTGQPERAAEATRAVFLVLARRARKLSRKTVLAGWLFHVTAVACRKLTRKSHRSRWGWRNIIRSPRSDAAAPATAWSQAASELDAAIDRLSSSRRDAFLLRALLNRDSGSVAGILRTSEGRAGKRAEQGITKVTRRLRRQGVPVKAETLSQLCSVEGCLPPLPPDLVDEILTSIEAGLKKRPSCNLARRTLNALAWTRWRRRLAIAIPSFFLFLATIVGVAWYVESRAGYSRLISTILIWSVKQEARKVPGLAQPARPWPVDAAGAHLNAAGVRGAGDLYQTTNIWLAHLRFAPDQWTALEPDRIGPLPNFLQPDGTVLLRHPKAQRSGLAGVLGFDFNWAQGDLEFGGARFTNVAVRFKGNGTYLGSLYGDKRAFKVDLNKFAKGQKLGGADELIFNNLVNDHSYVSDALAYEFFREAGVPTPRTAYAYLSVSVDGRWEKKPLGLYVMVEPVDEDFALERFGSKRTPVFKPVTYELFHDLGDDWSAYEAIYDLKTEATVEQRRRVIEFARLVTHAGDLEFVGRLGEFLDLDAFARFLAGQVLLSNYDSFLSNGQNFYLYLDPSSNKFGFIPWDLDLSWGSFFLLGTTRERELASIWHPWVGRHRLLERVMTVESFRELYRRQLEDQLARLFVPRRLRQRIDDMAQIVRGPIAAESAFRLGKFENAVSDRRTRRVPGEEGNGANRPAHSLKHFIEARAVSVRRQLDGTSEGIILERRARE